VGLVGSRARSSATARAARWSIHKVHAVNFRARISARRALKLRSRADKGQPVIARPAARRAGRKFRRGACENDRGQRQGMMRCGLIAPTAQDMVRKAQTLGLHRCCS